jgi:phosphatidate phosphatase APP1
MMAHRAVRRRGAPPLDRRIGAVAIGDEYTMGELNLFRTLDVEFPSCRVNCHSIAHADFGRGRHFLLLVTLGWFTNMAAFGSSAISQIKSDEWVVLFPTAANLSKDEGSWHLPIHGWIFEPEEGSILRKLVVSRLRKHLKLEPEDKNSDVFQKRIRLFLVDNERGKRITVRIGGHERQLAPSTPDGHFRGAIDLPVDEVNKLTQDGLLPVQVVTRPDDPRQFHGKIHLVPQRGLSVISDIDDTIKITEVGDKRKILENTFLKPFRPVEGMAELYDSWADEGAMFHFVSGSPWQLYEPLSTFTAALDIPPATFHLRRIRFTDVSVLQLLADPYQSKLNEVNRLLTTFPQRRFILVGDSGEKDPEVYGEIARRYPDRVLQILIRNVTRGQKSDKRFQKAMLNAPASRWQLFDQPSEITEFAR